MYFYIMLHDKEHDDNRLVRSLSSLSEFNLVAQVQEIAHHVTHTKYPLLKTFLTVITRLFQAHEDM
jgi:hypothetical protein